MNKRDEEKSDVHLSNLKILRRQHFIETFDNSNQLIHFIDLSYNKADIFYHGWIGNCNSNHMKSIYSGHFLEIFDDNRCRCMLTDCSKMKGDFTEVVRWYNSDLSPLLAEMGLEYNAILLPVDNFAQMSVREWQNNILSYKNVTFNGLNDAINWLALL